MESQEDGMIVVIIAESSSEDDETRSDLEPKIRIKSELNDEVKAEEVGHLIEAAEKHGELIDWNLFQGIKKENEAEYPDDCSNEEFYPTEDIEDDEEDEDNLLIESQVMHKARRKMLHPSECKSYVRELIKENPEYRKQKNKLVKYLATVMKALKVPLPPEDYYRVRDDDSLFECSKCYSVSATLPACQRHYQDKHGPRYLTCFACGVDFRSKTNLYKHEKRCIAPDIVYVLRARAIAVGLKGRGRPFLSLAQKTRTPQKFLCDECSATFLTKIGLTAHQHLHRGERPYKCQHCAAAYTSKCALTRHQYKHTDAMFICDLCGRAFKAKHVLVTHMDTHLPEKKFACHYEGCARRFANKLQLNIHIDGRHRLLPPPCTCQLCHRRFVRMSLLKIHMKKAHGLILMTRKMFFKTLPNLTDTQVKQGKIFYESDLTTHRTDHLRREDNSHEDEPQTSYRILREDTGEFSQLSIERSEHEQQSQNKEQSRNKKKKQRKEKKKVTSGHVQNDKELDVVKYLEDILKKKSQLIAEDANFIVIEKGEVQIPDRRALRTEYESLISNLKTEITDNGNSMPEI